MEGEVICRGGGSGFSRLSGRQLCRVHALHREEVVTDFSTCAFSGGGGGGVVSDRVEYIESVN